MKKVLIITYYWTPSGGAGIQRWLKFVKYLRHYGWEPIIYTPENPEMPATDESLQKDVPEKLTVLKTKIFEPYNFYKWFVGKKKDEKINAGFLSENKKPKFLENFSIWIRGNFFIPDARKFWIKPSVKFLSNYLRNNKVDVIVSTGPPHSLHLIALQLKRALNISWLADFRDPWTQIYYYDKLMLTKWADKKHHQLEKKVLQNADCVVTVGEYIKEELKKAGAKNASVITNGFDVEDVSQSAVQPDKKFSLAHSGSLLPQSNSEIVWHVLKDLVQSNPDFADALEIQLIGKTDVSAMESLKKNELEKFVKKINYLPHEQLIAMQQKAQVLLILLPNTVHSKGILTGKFFEYLSAKRPILAIGESDGDVAKILQETNAGKISGFNDYASLKKNIREYFEKFKAGNLICESTGIEKYSRKELTGKLAKLLDNLRNAV